MDALNILNSIQSSASNAIHILTWIKLQMNVFVNSDTTSLI